MFVLSSSPRKASVKRQSAGSQIPLLLLLLLLLPPLLMGIRLVDKAKTEQTELSRKKTPMNMTKHEQAVMMIERSRQRCMAQGFTKTCGSFAPRLPTTQSCVEDLSRGSFRRNRVLGSLASDPAYSWRTTRMILRLIGGVNETGP